MMRMRLGKGHHPSGGALVAIIIESDDGLLTVTVALPPKEASAFAEQMRLAAVEVGSGIIIPSAKVSQ